MGYSGGLHNPAVNAHGVLLSSVREFERLQAEAEKERRETAALQHGIDAANLSDHDKRFAQETALLDAVVVGSLKQHFGGSPSFDDAASGRFGAEPKRLANRLIEMIQTMPEGIDPEGFPLPEVDPGIVSYFADIMAEELQERLAPNSDRSNTAASIIDPVGNDEAFLADIDRAQSPHDFLSETRLHEANRTFQETLARLTGESPNEREARIENEQVRQREMNSGDPTPDKPWPLDAETGLPADSFAATFGPAGREEGQGKWITNAKA